MKLLVKLVGFVHWEPWSHVSGRVPAVTGTEDIVALPSARSRVSPAVSQPAPGMLL